ncbi:hypothetical protein GCM10023083_55220 [Streptomyces phyllanthi]
MQAAPCTVSQRINRRPNFRPRHVVPPSVPADEWFLYDQESPIAVGGRGLARGRIYNLEGQLIVSVVQEGLFRKLG